MIGTIGSDDTSSRGARRGIEPSLLVLLLLALLLRLAAIFVLDALRLTSANSESWMPAWSLYNGHGFAFNWYGLLKEPMPSSFLPPLYSWILCLALLLTRGSEHAAMVAAQLLNVILGTITVYLVARLTRLTWREPEQPQHPHARLPWILTDSRLVAAGIWAVYPPAVAHVAQTQTQTVETFLLVLLAFLVLRSLPEPKKTAGVLPGIALGLLLLSRPSSIIAWAVCIVLLWRRAPRRGTVLRFFALASAIALLVLTPWTVRNYRLHGRLIPVALNGGFNFYLGNGPYGAGEIPPLSFFFRRMPEAEQQALRARSEVERDRALYRMGGENILRDPAGELRSVWRRLVSFVLFRPFLFAGYPRWIAALFVVSYLVLLVPFLLALPRCRGPAGSFILGTIAATGMVGLAYIVSMRFRATVEPFMAIIGAGWLTGRGSAHSWEPDVRESASLSERPARFPQESA